jgi:Protein of unknown function (DUF1580)
VQNNVKEGNLLFETSFLVQDLVLRLPLGRNGRPIHPSTILRWIHQGIRGVRLEAMRLGGRWMTSEEAIARFLQRLSTTSDGNESGTCSRKEASQDQPAEQ